MSELGFLLEHGFGAAEYLDAFPGRREPQPRIYAKFRPQGVEASFLGLLDTGGHFCILNQEILADIRPQLSEPLDSATLRTAHGPISGEIHLHTIELIAEVGESLSIEATVFVSPEWQGPSFLGYTGVLDRVLIALDPQANRFYFRALG